MKTPVSKDKYAFPSMQFSNFAIEYLFENEKVLETVLACSYGAHVESLKQKIMLENLLTRSLSKYAQLTLL